jgi:hypothetical protein
VTRIYGDSVYHFDTLDEAVATIQSSLADEPGRVARVARAREISRRDHLYEHRAEQLVSELREGEHRRSIDGTAEHRIAWIIGCGRSGSTWLAEMLGDLPGIRHWHEPYYGRFFRHLAERPEELERKFAFFSQKRQKIWLAGLRDLFFRMVRDRYPGFGRHALVIKEVNTPELYPWLLELFPAGRMILLVRDPFDMLDSYLDLQKPGSWNTRFAEDHEPLSEANVRRTAEHIRATMTTALEAYERFPILQRQWVTYEDLLRNAVPGLQACGALISTSVDREAAREVAEKHHFRRHQQTGSLQFRRRGQAGVWRESENFTPQVREIAAEILGSLRTRLRYAEDSTPTEAAS